MIVITNNLVWSMASRTDLRVDSFPQFPPEDYNYNMYVRTIQNECPSYQLVGNSGVLSSKISLYVKSHCNCVNLGTCEKIPQ